MVRGIHWKNDAHNQIYQTGQNNWIIFFIWNRFHNRIEICQTKINNTSSVANVRRFFRYVTERHALPCPSVAVTCILPRVMISRCFIFTAQVDDGKVQEKCREFHRCLSETWSTTGNCYNSQLLVLCCLWRCMTMGCFLLTHRKKLFMKLYSAVSLTGNSLRLNSDYH